MASQTASFPPPRRIMFFGPGPLPSGDSPLGPGVSNRLWQFMQPALQAGASCMTVFIQSDQVSVGASQEHTWEGHPWQSVAVSATACKDGSLVPLVERFAPDVMVGAATLLAGATACALAGQRPVWVDLFGDPLAEISAKAQVLGDAFGTDEYLEVWALMQAVWARADFFSTVSRRQIHALLGQLLAAGWCDQHSAPDCSQLQSHIHCMPCCLQTLDLFEDQPPVNRTAWLKEQGLPKDAKILLWSGGFNAWADPAGLVQTAATVLQRRPDTWLVTTGGQLPGYLSAVYDRFLAAVAASPQRGRMRAMGWRPLDESNTWLRVADVAVMLDRPCSETVLGARNRLLYHAAARTPILGTQGTEVVQEMAEEGALLAIPPGRPQAAADFIVKLLDNPPSARQLGEAGYAYCRRHYLFEQHNRQFAEFLAQPARRAPRTQGSGPALAAALLDWPARQAEADELARYRAGRMSRLCQWLNKVFTKKSS